MVSGVVGYLDIAKAESSAPNPSVPQFTIEYVDNSYDVPLVITTTTDPYNGQQVTHRSGGYHVENKTIELSIKNQPLSSESLGNNSDNGLYYTVRVKGHFGTEWQEQSVSAVRPSDSYVPWPIEYQTTKIQASNSGYTILTYVKGQSIWPMRNGDQIDIQVKAFVGYQKFFWNTDHMFPLYDGNAFDVSAESDWSSTQTITMIAGSVFVSSSHTSAVAPTPTATPQVEPSTPPTPMSTCPQNPTATSGQLVSGYSTFLNLNAVEIAIAVLLGVIAVLLVFVVVYLRRRR